MRQAFIKTLERLAQKDKSIVLLTADLGFTVFENFRQKFPDRFVNVGVAETNLIGMAAGLALSGFTPIAYSIATFASLRPFEFIRNDVCFHQANVKIVGVGGGLGYASAGFSHCNFEDVAALRALPNLMILSPADPVETAILTEAAVKHQGPVYLRLGKVGEPVIHKKRPKLTLGKGLIFQTGKQAAILTTGGVTANVITALEQISFRPTVAIFPTLKPLDKALIIKLARSHQYLFSVEEHSINGGLGTAVAEVLAESGIKAKLRRLGIVNSDLPKSGSQEWLRHYCGLSAPKIAAAVKSVL